LAWHSGGLRANELAAQMNDTGPAGQEFRLRLLQFWDEVIRETAPDGPVSDLTTRLYRHDNYQPMMVNGVPQVRFVPRDSIYICVLLF